MADIKEAKKLLDEINTAVASYDPVLKELDFFSSVGFLQLCYRD